MKHCSSAGALNIWKRRENFAFLATQFFTAFVIQGFRGVFHSLSLAFRFTTSVSFSSRLSNAASMLCSRFTKKNSEWRSLSNVTCVCSSFKKGGTLICFFSEELLLTGIWTVIAKWSDILTFSTFASTSQSLMYYAVNDGARFTCHSSGTFYFQEWAFHEPVLAATWEPKQVSDFHLDCGHYMRTGVFSPPLRSSPQVLIL